MRSFPGPTPRVILTLLVTIWQVLVGGVRVFFVDSLKSGMIDIRPLGRAARLLSAFGLLLVFGYLFGILFNDVLRTQTALEPLVFQSGAERGLMAPSIAVPLTLATITLAWSYLLTGALHIERRARLAVLAIYFFFGFLGLAQGIMGSAAAGASWAVPATAVVLLGFLVALLAAFRILPGRTTPLAVEFSLMLGLQGGLNIFAVALAVSAQQRTGFPYVNGYLLSETLDLTRLMIIPFLIISGSEMGNFARDFSGWAAKSVRENAGLWTPALLALFLLLRWLGLLRELLDAGIGGGQLRAWLGAALLVGGLAIVFAWRRRQPGGEAVPAGLITRLIVLSQSVLISLGPLLTIVGAFFTVVIIVLAGRGDVDLAGLSAQANDAIGVISTVNAIYRDVVHALLAALGVGVAVLGVRRGQPTIAAFGLALAWTRALEWLMEFARPLSALSFDYKDVDMLLLGVLTAATLYLARQGIAGPRPGAPHSSVAEAAPAPGLTSERALHLLALAILGWVLTQTSFLDNPFSPFFAFAGVFFLVFGILWGVLTAGGKFANRETPEYPRASRLLMYLGYALLSLTVSHWFIVSHNVQAQAIQSSLTLSGFRVYGLTLAYLAFIEAGKPLLE